MQSDIHALEFPDEHFDFVLAEGVLEYCADIERAFRELVRGLKPGSHLVASVDSLYYVVWAMASAGELDEISGLLQEGRYLDEDGVYCNALTPEDFRILAEECGLEVIRLIGKPVLCQYMSEKQKDAIKGRKEFEKLLELELSLCESPR
jgi:SAM-dependent methyltransferase